MGQYNEARKNGSEPVDISRKMDGALAAIGMLEPVLIKKVYSQIFLRVPNSSNSRKITGIP